MTQLLSPSSIACSCESRVHYSRVRPSKCPGLSKAALTCAHLPKVFTCAHLPKLLTCAHLPKVLDLQLGLRPRICLKHLERALQQVAPRDADLHQQQ